MSADWTQTRNFYGLSVEEKFHQPCTAWHKSGFYIFAAAAAGTICVFHVGTTKVCNSYNCWASPYHGYNKYLPSKGYGHCITLSAMFGLMFSKSARCPDDLQAELSIAGRGSPQGPSQECTCTGLQSGHQYFGHMQF